MKQTESIGLMYEDELPLDMPEADYDEWFKRSCVIDGVRMGPRYEREIYRVSCALPDLGYIIAIALWAAMLAVAAAWATVETVRRARER